MKFLIIGLLMCNSVYAAWHSEQQPVMGTLVTVELWHEEPAKARQVIKQVMDEMHRIDQLMSHVKSDSELFLLNKQASSKSVQVSQELFDLIKKSIEVSELSHGAFDITFESVGYLYDYRNKVKPSEEEIKKLLDAISYQYIQLNEKEHEVFFKHKNVKINLGGIAKGYAVDNGIAILKKLNIKNAIVTAGGDSRILGDRRGRPWIVGIQDPRNKNKNAVILPLDNIALSTSGDYERYFEEDGKRYHHIINPKNGQSAYEVQSVSVLGPEAVMTDALSTTVFVLGVEQGLKLINNLPNYDVIIVDNKRKLHYSDELMPPE